MNGSEMNDGQQTSTSLPGLVLIKSFKVDLDEYLKETVLNQPVVVNQVDLLFRHQCGKEIHSFQFCFSDCEKQSEFKEIVQQRGGHVSRIGDNSEYAIRLFNPDDQYIKGYVGDIFNVKFIVDCNEANCLLDLRDYRIGESVVVDEFDPNLVMKGVVKWKHAKLKSDLKTSDTGYNSTIDDFDDGDDIQQFKKAIYPNIKSKYTIREDNNILQTVLQYPGDESLRGLRLWKKLQRGGKLNGRSPQSLNNRFRKSIYPNLDIYDLTDLQKREIISWSSGHRKRWNLSKQQKHRDNTGDVLLKISKTEASEKVNELQNCDLARIDSSTTDRIGLITNTCENALMPFTYKLPAFSNKSDECIMDEETVKELPSSSDNSIINSYSNDWIERHNINRKPTQSNVDKFSGPCHSSPCSAVTGNDDDDDDEEEDSLSNNSSDELWDSPYHNKGNHDITIDTDSDIEELISKKTVINKPKHKRQPYTQQADLEIIGYLQRNGCLSDVGGIKIWKQMEVKKVLPGRTHQSLKNRFMKIILPNIEKYSLTEEQQNQFSRLMTVVKRRSAISSGITIKKND